MENIVEAIVRWLKETITAERELLRMHWLHSHHKLNYSDASYQVYQEWANR